MMNFIFRIIISSLAIFLAAYLLPGVSINGYAAALLVALVLAVLNTFLKPLLVFLTIPVTLLTLGLFLFVINAMLIWIAHLIVADFHLNNFWWALLFSIVVSILISFMQQLAGEKQNHAG